MKNMESNGSKPIQRSEGATPSEQYLKKLCDRSFLSLWSYARIHRDQGRPGKEICDLLVVFEDHIIIFSDKHCKFPDTGNLERDWRRWFREAIEKSAQEIWGAERWIKTYPKRIFLDRACTQPFPLDLPSPSKARFHRIIVAHGASERCSREMGGSGSLMIVSPLIGTKHYAINDGIMPFAIGQVDPDKGYVHIFDDTTLDIVMQTLDTITDFVSYLSKKEQFLSDGRFYVFAAGEEELLAHYLTKTNEEGEHDFILPADLRAENFLGFNLLEGSWEDFAQSPPRKSQIVANQISYEWDALIETFNKHVLEGTQYYATDPEIRTQEKTVRFLAREPRTRRRMLAKAFIGLIKKTPASDRCTRTMLPSKPGDPHYVFLLLPYLKDVEYSKYREIRRDLLQRYCIITKLDFPDAQDIIGIATETKADIDPDASFDTAYLDAKTWTEEEQTEARRLKQELIGQGLLGDKYVTTKWMERDYPTTYPPSHVVAREPIYAMKGRDRNAPCPCGSGKKYKHCHGKVNW